MILSEAHNFPPKENQNQNQNRNELINMCCTTMNTPTPHDSKLACEKPVIIQDPPVRQRRRVRFANNGESDDVEINVLGPLLEPASKMSEETKEDIWWQKSNFESFNGNANLLAQEAIRRETVASKGYKMAFLSAYLGCESPDGPSLEQIHYLKQWTKAAFSRRGLERLCIIELAQLRAERKRKTIAAVLDAQDCSANMNSDERADFIQSVSVCRSQAARTFATLLGEGDEFAVKQGQMKTTEQNVARTNEENKEGKNDKKAPKSEKRIFNRDKKSFRMLRLRRRVGS